MFDMLTSREASGDDYVGDRASDVMLAQAHSASAEAYLKLSYKYTTPAGRAADCVDRARFMRISTPDVHHDPIYLLGLHATKSIELGLTSHTNIMCGVEARYELERMGGDPSRAVVFKPLFDVLDDFGMLYAAEQIGVRPNDAEHVCASFACQRKVTRKSELRECAGKCSVGFKPHYCSRECQREVRSSRMYYLTVLTLKRTLTGLATAQEPLQTNQKVRPEGGEGSRFDQRCRRVPARCLPR